MKRITLLLLFLGLFMNHMLGQEPNLPYVSYSTKTGTHTDTRDGKTYAYKKYGDYEWFMQNLNWDGYDGSNAATRGTVGFWGSADPDGSKYGRFYPSKTVACPDGWKVAIRKDYAALVDSVSAEYKVPDLVDLSGNMYTFKEAMKYLRGGNVKPNAADALWESNTGTVDLAKANEIQFNILPMGEHDGTDYKIGGEVGRRTWLVTTTADRFQNNPIADKDGINALRHSSTSGGIGAIRCLRLPLPDVNITTAYPTEIEIKQINSAEKEVARHLGRMKRLDHVPTGFYLAAGKTMKIELTTLTSARDGAKPQVVIGTRGQMPVIHTATNTNAGQKITEINLVEGVNTITAPVVAETGGGGIIYFRYVTQVAGEPVGNVKVKILAGGDEVRTPHYVYGETGHDEFQVMLSEYNTPEVIFTSDEVVVVTSKVSALEHSATTDKKLWIEHLHKLLEIEDDISGMDDNDSNPLHHRMKKGESRHLFVQTRFSSPNASDWRVAYPGASRYLTPFKTPTNGYVNVSWQVAHEIGHQHQQLAYLVPQAGESTVNIYSFKVAAYFDQGNASPIYVRTPQDKIDVFHRTYMKLPDEERIYEMDGTKLQGIIEGVNRDEMRMVPWELQFYIFGDEFFKRLHRITREEKVTNNTGREVNDMRKVYLISRASLISGYDLRKYYDAWGIVVENKESQDKLDKMIKDAGLQEPPRIDELAYVSGSKFMAGDYAGWLPLAMDKGIKTSVPANWTWHAPVEPEREPKESFESNVLADTYVTDLSGHTATNYGIAPQLEIKLNDVAGYHRQAYVKFALDDLAKYTNTTDEEVDVTVKFYVTTANTDIEKTDWIITPVENTDWEEAKINWDNKPVVIGTPIGKKPGFAPDGSVEPSDNNNRILFDITEYALSEYAKGNKTITLHISNSIAGTKVNSTFASKEHPDVLVHPKLAVNIYTKGEVIMKQTITFPTFPISITENTGAFAAGAVASSGLAVTYISSNTAVATVTEDGTIEPLTAGTTVITVTQEGNAQYTPVTVTQTLTVLKKGQTTQTIKFPVFPMNITESTAEFAAGATASSNLAITYTSSDVTVATVSATGMIKPLKAGATTITAIQAGNDDFGSASVTQLLTVAKAPLKAQTITFTAFPANVKVSTPGFVAEAIATSGLAVTYTSSDIAVATVTTDGTIKPLKAGTTTITAAQAGNDEYLSATATQELTVLADDILTSQTIAFPAFPSNVTVSTAEFTAGASASSNLAITYTSSDITVATITTDGTIKPLKVGTTIITATQAGNAGFTPTSVTQLLTVLVDGPVSQMITFPAFPSNVTVSTAEFTADASASSNLAITYTSSDITVATVTADGTIKPLKVGTTTITATQVGNAGFTPTSVTQLLTVLVDGPVSQMITFPAFPSNVTVSTAEFTAGASASSNLAITYTSSDITVATVTAAGTIKPLKVGTTTITATQVGNAGFTPTSVTQVLIVAKDPLKEQSITFPVFEASITVSTTPFTAGASATSGLTVTYTSSDIAVATVTTDGTIKPLTAGTTTITAAQAGNDEYLPVTATQTLTVLDAGQQTQTITFPAFEANITVSTTPFTAGASASSNLAITYTSSDITVATVAEDGTITPLTAGTTIITATQAGSVGFGSATATQELIVLKAGQQAQGITFPIFSANVTESTAEFAAGASASSGLAVTYTSSDITVATVTTDGIIKPLKGGTTTITATQVGSDEFAPVSATQVLVVAKDAPVSQTIIFPAFVANITVSTAEFAAGASASSGLAVTYTSSDITVATVTTDGIIKPLKIGTTIITATQAGNDGFTATSVTQLLTVLKDAPVSQTIIFPAFEANITVSTAEFAAVASASSGLAVTYTSSDIAVATVTTDGIIKPLKIGTTIITATQAGNDGFTATSVTQLLTVLKDAPVSQTIIFPAFEANITVSTAEFAAGASASSGLAVTYTSSDVTVATVSATGMIKPLKAGATTIAATQAGNDGFAPTSATQVLTVAKDPVAELKDQTIAFPALPGNVTVSTVAFGAGASASSGLAITYTSSDVTVATVSAAGMIKPLKVGTTTITATQVGNAEYKPATAQTQVLTVAKDPVVELKDQTIAFPALPANVTVSTAAFGAGASASSGLAITYTSSDVTVATVSAAGMIKPLKVGTTTITATQAGNTEYKAATAQTQVLTVAKDPVVGESGITINGLAWNEAVYQIPCNYTDGIIKLAVNNGTIVVNGVEALYHNINVNKITGKTIDFTVKSGATEKPYTLEIKRDLRFEEVVATKWGTTYIVNNNTTSNGGFTFTGYKWFVDGIEVATRQYYNATGTTSGVYTLELTLADNSVAVTCPATKTPASGKMKVYPNAVRVGETVWADASDMPTEFVDGTANIYTYSMTGYRNSQPTKMTEAKTPITLPSTPGVYVVKIVSQYFEQEFKVIVK